MSKTNPGGTILNNEPLREDERRELNNNDIVQICGRRFLFTCGALAVSRPHRPALQQHAPHCSIKRDLVLHRGCADMVQQVLTDATQRLVLPGAEPTMKLKLGSVLKADMPKQEKVLTPKQEKARDTPKQEKARASP